MGRPRKFVSSPVPQWACRVRALRESYRLTLVDFGKLLGCSPIVISRWERGIKKPPAEYFITMGKISRRPSGWYFWKLAGIAPADARRMLGDGRGLG